MHHLDPIAQAVHDHAQHHRMVQVQRVAGAGIVDVIARIVGQPVIAAVVQPPEGQRRPHLVAFAGVVIDHVQNDLDAGGMQPRDHVLEFGNVAAREIARIGGEKAQRLIAPEIHQPLFDQKAVVQEGLHRQQLDRGDAELLQMLQHRVRGQRQEAARMGHLGVKLGQALDMRLVDDRLRDRRARGVVVAPGEGRVLDHAARHVAGAVARIQRQVRLGGADRIAHQRVMPDRMARQPLGIGVQKQLVVVEAVPLGRGIGAIGAIAVALARPQPRDIAVPDIAIAFGQVDPVGLGPAVGGEQAQRHPPRMNGEHGEVHTFAVKGRAKGIGAPGSDRPVGHQAVVITLNKSA